MTPLVEVVARAICCPDGPCDAERLRCPDQCRVSAYEPKASRAIAAYRAALAKEGWVVVPIVPTEEMRIAGGLVRASVPERTWGMMLAVAPPAPAEKPEGGGAASPCRFIPAHAGNTLAAP